MNKQAVQNLYNNLKARANGFDVEYADFERQIQDEQKRKNLHKNLTERVDGFDVDYPTFTQKLGLNEQQATTIGDDSRSAAFGGMADPIYSGMYNYHQAVKDKEDALQREEAARLPMSQADKERDAEIRRLTAEGAFTGEPNGTTLSIDPNTGSPVMNTVKGQGLQYHPEYNLNQAEIDRLKAEQPSYMTREVKTPQDLLAKTAEAWSANTPDGQNAKEMLELGLIDKEEYTQMMVKANEDYINQQNRILGQKATNATITDISKTINPIIEKMQAERREAMQRAAGQGHMRGGAYGAIGAQMSANTAYDAKKDAVLSEYLQAQQYLVDAIKISEAAQKGQGFWKGLGGSLGDVDTWDMGISQLVRSANLKKIVEKYEKKSDSLTDSEKALMDAAVAYMSACAYNSDKLSRLYKAGQTTGESLPFMLQFAVMPIGAIKDKVAKGILGYGIEQFGGKALQTAGKYSFGRAAAETGVSLLGNIAAAGVQTGAFGGAKIAEGTISRMTGDIKPEFDENGRIVYGGRENQQGLGEALWNAGVDTYVENLSEMILTSGDPIKAWVGGTNLFKNLNKNEVVQVLAKMGDKWSGSTMGKIAGRMQFRNYPEEVAEEYVGNLLRWGMSTDVHSAAEAGLDADSQIDLWMGLAPTSIAFAGLGLGEYSVRGGIDRFQSSQAARKLRKIMLEGEERKYLENLLKSRDSDEFKFAAHDVVKSILRNDKLSVQEKRAYLDNLYVTYQSQLALEAEDAKIANEVKTDVQGITNKNNGYVYPVSLAGDPNTQGHIVAGYVEVDMTDPSKPRIGNDEIVTVKLNDGRVVQLSTRELDLTGTPQMAQEVFNERADERIQTRKNLDQSMKAFHAGDGCLIKVPNAETGVEEELPSKIISVTDEGVQVEIMASDGTLIPVLIPHDEALATISVVTLKEDKQEQPLGGQQTEGETEGEPEGEPEDENIVEFTNGTETMRTVDNGDGTYTYTEKGEDGIEYKITQTADWFARNGFVMVESEKQEGTINDTTGGKPEVKKPVVPNLQTMSADEYGASTVEYLNGDRQTAKDYIKAELDKAKKVLTNLNKQQVKNWTDIADFKSQNDALNAQKQAAQQMVSKLEAALLAVASYKTQAELQAEAERKAREAAMREQRRQLAEAEAAGDIEAKWQNTKKTVGFAATKTLPNGQKVNGHYILTEAGDVIPSHEPRKNYADSEGYVMENGQNVNDNNYKDPEVQKIAIDIAQNYGGQAVEQMPFLENKAGRVLSGNNRTISGIIAAENNTDQAYLAALAENAQQYGFTPEQLAEYQHPRLQFVVEDELPFTTGTFAMFNQQEKKTKSSVNRAVANSKMVTEAVRDRLLEIMDQYDSLDSFFGSSNAASAITQTLINEGLMTKQEVAEKMDDSGIFNQTGKEYVTDMLLGTLFDEQTIRMLAGEKTLKQAILRALPSIVENRRLKGYELTENINKAISLLYEARKANKGKSTAEAFQLYLRQVDAFKGKVKDNFSEFEIILAGEMANGVERTRDLLNMYNNSAENEANGQDSLFDKRTPEDIKQQVYEHYAKQQPELTAAINGAAVEGAESQSSVPSSTEELGEVRQVISPEQLAALRQQAQEFSDKLGVPIVVFDSIDEVPETESAAKELYKKEGNKVDAWMSADGKTIYVNANSPEIQKEGGLQRKVFHEVVAHKGLRQLMGNQTFGQLCAYVWEAMPVDQRVKYYDYAQQNYPGRSEDELRLIAADEYMAFNAEKFTSLDANDQSEAANEVRTIWQKIADKLRELLDKILGDSYMSDDALAELYKMSYNNLRQQAQDNKIVPERPNSKQLQGMSYNVAEAEDYIGRVVRNILDENGYNDVEIVGTKVIGSRVNGNAREDSDLDAIVEFKGNAREDSLFNLFAEQNIELDGVKVDVNPITEGKSGTIEQFMRRSEEYLDSQPKQFGENTRFSVKNNAKNLHNSEKSSTFARELSKATYPLGKSSILIDDEWSKIAIESQRESMPATAPWRDGIGDVMVHTNLPAIKGKFAELHAKAKAGNIEAASELVKAVVKRERVKELAERFPNAIVAIPHAEEASGKNKLPVAYAAEFVAEGLGFADEIIQVNKPHHTGSDKVGRFVRRARYEGNVEQGKEYILVDDHITMGGTLRDLKDYIESKGGKVVAISTLSASAGGTKLNPDAEQINALEDAGITDEQLKNLGIADNLYGITKSEARELLVLANGGGKSRSPKGYAGRDGLAKGTSQVAGDNDPRFSVTGTQVVPIDGKSLVGLHNISAEKLRKALKMGGLANPSAAVIDLARQNHHGYGEVSLVMPSSLVDSETGRNAGTYAGDAYTPMYPNVEYRAGKETAKRLDELTKGLPEDLAFAIQNNVRDYMDKNRNYSGLEYVYLAQQGRELPIEHTPRRYPYISIEDIYKRLGMEYPGFYDSSSYDAYEKLEGEQLAEFNLWLEQYGDQEKIDKRKEMVARMRSEGKDGAANYMEDRWGEHWSFSAYDSALYRIMQDGRDAGKENYGRTIEKAQTIIDTEGLRPAFEAWLQKEIDKLGYNEVIFAGWTRDGDRRYLPNTIENASRLMNKEGDTNWREGAGVSETKSMLMPKFRTLNQIRKHKDILENDEEKIKTAYEEVGHDWTSLGIDFRDYTQKDGHAYGLDDNPFIAVDNALMRIQEAMMKADPIAYLNREYRYQIPADNEWAGRIAEMKERIANLPSRYFETKFRRPVYLDEFRNAVVPNDLPTELRDGLEKAGLTLFEYDPKEEGARRAATLQATEDEGIRFSVSGGLETDRTLNKAAREEMQQIKDAALADGTFMKAPNGKRSNLNERQWLQVRTRAFQRMFGDWQNDPENATKVLDENGEPMVVYHGTQSVFNIFRKDRKNKNYGSRLSDGFYFSPKRSVSEFYATHPLEGIIGEVKSVFLNIKKPLLIKNVPDYREKLREYEVGLDVVSRDRFRALDESEQLKQMGYDGAIELPEDGLPGEIVAFDPNQIKSATHNDGSFSEENDDIRFSVSNASEEIFFSNAERAVESIKQEKATPAQWLAMIEKAGGLKAGEDKWIGLSDWLKAQHATVEMQPSETRSQYIVRLGEASKKFTISKQDILDYIRQNKIQIEEEQYGDVYDNPRFKELEAEFSDVVWNIDDILTRRWVEADNELANFYDEMRHKYGEDFLDQLNEPEQRVEQYLIDAREEFNHEVPQDDDAFKEMVRRYGDDFEQAFWSDGTRLFANENDAAGYYLENKQIESTRMKYTTEGLKNKREIALVVPTIESWNEGDAIHFGDAGEGRAVAWVRFGDTDRTLVDGRDTYANVLVIDEIQSKRHQEGRDKGYRYQPKDQLMQEWNDAGKRRIQLARDWQAAHPNFTNAEWYAYANGEEYQKAIRDEQEAEERLDKSNKQIPAAPFEKNWQELAMKRMLRFAAENDYDKVAWTTGEQQANRYDLGKKLEEMSVVYNDETGLYDVFVTEKGGDPEEDSYRLDEGLDDEGLRRTIGKDLYNRVMEQGKQEGWMGPVDLTGDDLIIGVDGMKGFYDEMLPRFMQKYGKKWGVQVGEVTMPDLEEGYQTMHSIDITPEMRESVLQGQPMFSVTGSRGTMDAQPGENKVQYAARIAEEIKRENPKDTSLDEAIRFSITVNHNSPYLLKRADGAFVDPETGERLGFDLRFIGKGEGGQAHGYGSYFSKNDIRSYGEGYGFSLRDIKDAFDTSRWQSFGVGDAFDVAKGYLLEAHSEKAPSLRKWLEDRLAQKQELLKNYEGKVANTAEEDLMVFRAEADVQYIPALLRDMVKDIDTRNRHHYDVEIPDNDGTNYLDEDKPLTPEQIAMLREQNDKDHAGLRGFLLYAERKNEQGSDEYPFRTFYSDLSAPSGAHMSPKAISEFLSRAGFVGIHYDGRRDGECYVIFNPDDAVITDHIRFSVTSGESVLPKTPDAFYLRHPMRSTYNTNGDIVGDDQIRSDKFKEWFGDWQNDPEHASKVVDADGKPLVVWHGTTKNFSVFDKKKIGKANNGRVGFFFTPDESLATDFTRYRWQNTESKLKPNAHNMPVYLNIKNPLYITARQYVMNVLDNMDLTGYDGVIITPFDEGDKRAWDSLFGGEKSGSKEFDYNQYVVFDPNQIKSATENNGEFSKDNDDIRFSVNNPSTLSRSETVTKALVQQANNNYNIMQSALKKVTADLKGIRAAMRMQSDYDRKVVDALLNLYNTLLQENGVWAQYMPDTTRRIATQIVHAIGKQNITEEVNTIMDHMVHAQAKAAQRQWDKLRQTPIDKINISGVVMQGKVALEGQHALKAMNDALQANMTIEQIEEQINQLMDMEDNATDESLKTQYKGQWIGLTIAAQHLERLQHLQEERQQLDLELQSARSNKALKPAARQQLVDNIKQAMRDNYIEQAEAYTRSTQDLSEYVNTQEGRAKDFIRRQDANRDKIRSYAQRDLEGLATNPNRNRTRGNVARSIWDAFASPIRDLQSLLRLTGLHAPDGEGYLYNHFMRNWMDGADMERTGIVAASKTLDEKIAELTHGKYKTWEEAARKINDASHNMFGITMLNGVDGKDMPVTEEIPLNAGNALYIYAVNKMNDGRMKLNGMNITEEDVQALADKVREQFGQEILDVVDWVQSDFFSQLRNRYNPTHEALFGAPMDAIDNYFPLRINANARQQNEDLSEPDTDAARLLAGTSTGAIKRRTRNSLPLDVRNADFFQEVIRHISQMERWNAFAQWNRDANILFSDINFRNRIKGMNGTIYGEGDKLYNYMKDAFRVAIGTYKPKTDTFSEITLNMAKGVTSAKINFRIFTALKQIASFPAFFTYMQDGVFVQSYLRNWLKPHETMKWAKENLPNFEKRVSKRDMGDMRLMQRSTDWQWNKRILEWSSKYGMFFNVFFDTLTCATGARAVYDSHLADYMKKGYSEEDARNRARQDAEQAFNTSQQSSEGAFMSAVQQDRNLVTAALTVFRTSPIQYTRNFFYHTRNLLRKFGEGKRDEQIAFRMGQYKNDGLNDEQARKAAEKDYNKSLRQDIVGFVVYGALLNILWRLAGQIPYLLLGDDDDKKKQILQDATSGGAWFSPFTGLLGGGIVESALDGNGSVADMFAPEMPFTQDIKRAGQYLSNDKYAEFASQALSVLMQSGTGFDPLTASDMVSRIVTTLGSEEELDAATQALRVSQALLSIPQSQYEQMLIDKVVSGETDEDAALEDYIRYQKIHTAPLTWWLRGEESDEKAEENAEKRFNKLLTDRDKIKNPEDYEE